MDRLDSCRRGSIGGRGRRAPGPDQEGGRPRAAPKCGYMGAWASARGRLGVWACTGARLVRAAGSRRCAGGARVDSGGSASCLKMTYRDGQQSTFVPPRDAELAAAAGAVVDPRVTKKRGVNVKSAISALNYLVRSLARP